MPWMLLTERGCETDERRGRNGQSDESGDGPREGAAWIMIGGLDRALIQAGIVARLVESAPPPVAILAAGFAVTNAVLVADARADAFERRWERLRACRFLPSSALGSYRLLGAVNGMFDDLAASLAEIVQSRSARMRVPADVLVATEEGFTMLAADNTTSSWRAHVKGSLRYNTESPPLLAGAIREAAVRANVILVLGLERTARSHPDVDAACRAASAAGVPVAFVTAASPRKAGLFDYLLPGSGTPERFIREGRAAADRWLASAGPNGSKREPGQVPFGGAAAGAEPLSAPDADAGLWSNDASDASNWLK